LKDTFLQKQLEDRQKQGLLRSLSPQNNLIDFASNDYLGLARCAHYADTIRAEMKQLDYRNQVGSTGSRLLTGNAAYSEEVENKIATYHCAQAGLVFNSGYAANIGLLSSVPQKEDSLLYDELSHASIFDGVRLSKAQSFPFRHNDLQHLKERLQFFLNNKKENANCFVVVESVYSMGGDVAPLEEIVALCEQHHAFLIVDEAHATGLFGRKGEGRVVACSLQDNVFARVHTFGKALGCHGAIVLGSTVLRNYLINFSRAFIYTTALPLHEWVAIKVAYELLGEKENSFATIHALIDFFRTQRTHYEIELIADSHSPIQSVRIGGNLLTKQMALAIQQDGLDVRPILSPTVAKGKERIRICLHSFNTQEEVLKLMESIKRNKNKFT
jgi:8-amino-7-oxononanoate synthase